MPNIVGFAISSEGYSFLEAIEPLLTLALVKRDKDARVFSCHRMVQTQFRYFLPHEERQQAFDRAVALIYHAFPTQSDATNQNQLYQQWVQCNKCLEHVLHLKDRFVEERKNSEEFRAPPPFCELLKDCQRWAQSRTIPGPVSDLTLNSDQVSL